MLNTNIFLFLENENKILCRAPTGEVQATVRDKVSHTIYQKHFSIDKSADVIILICYL